MKKIILICSLMMVCGMIIANNVYTIGTGTQTTFLAPFSTNWNYSWCKMLYTKAELNAAGFYSGNIHGIAFQIGEDAIIGGKPVNYIVNNVKFYIRSKSITSYGSSNNDDGTAFPSSPSTQVFSGNLVFNSLGSEWIEIGFSTPFNWNGQSSIEILCKCDDGSWYYGYPYFRYTSATNMCVYKNGSSTPSNSYGYRTSNRPNIRFAVVNSAPNPANYVYPANNGYAFTVGDSLTWGCGGGYPNKFDVYFGTSSNPPKVVTGQQSMTYSLPVLNPGTTYYWKIVPQNGSGPASNCPVWSFKTPTSTQLAEGFESYTFPPPGWDNPGSWTQRSNERIEGGRAAQKSANDNNQYLLVTPKLKINSDSSLNFWGFCSSANQYIQILYSADKTNWQQLGSNQYINYKKVFQYFSIPLSSLANNNYYLGIRTAPGPASYIIDCVFGPEKVPEPPNLVSPANNSTGVSITPTFSWSPQSGVSPSGYKVFCDQNNPPTTQIDNVTQTSYTLNSPLLYDTTYYWSVSAYTAAAEGEKATAFSFRTIRQAPGIPTLISPDDNANNVNIKPTLTWNAPASGGTPAGYKIYFGTSSTPPLFTNTASTSYTFTDELSYDTTYYWTVSAYNDGGESNKASVRSFTTRTDPTIITTFPYTAGDFENNGTLPTNWEVAEGVSGSTIHWAVKSGKTPHGPRSAHSGSYYGWLKGYRTSSSYNPYYLVTPPINLGSNPKQLNYRYWIGTSTVANPLSVEISTDQINWNILYTHSNANNTLNWYQNVINLSDYINSTVYIRFKGMVNNLKGKTDLGLDDIVIEEIPASPVLSYDFNTIDFGLVNNNIVNGPKYLTVFNTGGGTLEVDNVYFSGTNADEFSLGSMGTISLEHSESYSIPIYVTPSTIGTLTATLVISYNQENYNISLTAEGLPPAVLVLGTEDSDYGLPIEPYHINSYNQTIFLKNEINKSNIIDKISYYWDVSTAANATTTNWTVYVGHTQLSSFANSSDWVPINQLTQVFNGDVTLPATAGWIEITLENPFSYNNVDNLVVAVNASDESIGNDDNYFHCTTYRTRAYRSLVCHQDSKGGKGIDPDEPPEGELIEGYPNIKFDFKGDQPPLPVELTSFFATISNQNKVNLNWVSQTETDLIGYYVRRGTDNNLSNANVISPLINASNTSQPKAYMYTDTDLNVSGTYHYWLQYNGINGTTGFKGPIEVNYEANANSSGDIPLVTSLDNVYPNPFNPIAYIPYTLETKSEVKFIIYNTRGQVVKTFDLGTQDRGHHRITWDGRDNDGSLCGNGIYYLIMQAGKTQYQRKAVLMK